MWISWPTIDNLGIQMYDRASAALAHTSPLMHVHRL